MNINHDKENCKVWIEKEGFIAEVKYEIADETLNILHTFVPKQFERQGIASELVRYTYNYAIQQQLKVTATCPYARAWLKKHSSQ